MKHLVLVSADQSLFNLLVTKKVLMVISLLMIDDIVDEDEQEIMIPMKQVRIPKQRILNVVNDLEEGREMLHNQGQHLQHTVIPQLICPNALTRKVDLNLNNNEKEGRILLQTRLRS